MNTAKKFVFGFNRVLYGCFVLIAIYYAAFNKDFIEAASSLGIGLIFDPFNTEESWTDRPRWQKVWLIVHLAVAAGLLGYGLTRP